MTKKELLKWYNSLNTEDMPKHIEIEDTNNNLILLNGVWQHVPNIWTLFNNGKVWRFIETNPKHGYVSHVKVFHDEAAAIQYAYDHLNMTHLMLSGSSHEDILCRHLQEKYWYSEEQAKESIERMAKHKDIFDEFFNHVRIGKFRGKDHKQIEVHGHTAEQLHLHYNLSPLGAYNYLVYLRDDPEQAVADLEAGLPRK